ncbi:MAG TPA: molybdopterin oxidoreductase family protein [Solirubrobacteraceae bacterium]|nr:molybdopterin oxidoreductase family protein [Solirubrobacteraceae bacterium]
MARTVYRQCTLCEAHCGIKVEVEGGRVLRISGDPDDVMSRGYICPKAAALADLHTDPDRLRRPVKRVGDRFVEIGWDEAFALAANGLRRVQERHGRDSLATYLGNPSVHSSAVLAAGLLRRVIGSRNNYSATSVDQLPQYMSSHEMFGHFALLPIPDIDRTDYMLVMGANPAVSNGSVMTAPGARHRLKAITDRGGRVVVVDPRRSETARRASEHVSVKPGGDPYLLLGMLHTVFADGVVRLGRLSAYCDGIGELEALAATWAPARAADHAGVDEETIVRLAREFAAAPSAVAYGRVGVCHQETGSVTHWLINALNAVTGNLDRPGGAMFTTPPIDVLSVGELVLGKSQFGRYRQRVSGLPEFMDELPVAGLADEILTPGTGQVRGMLVHAGNPVLSAPGGPRLEQALAQLEWCVAVDMYVTETSRHANVILPPVSQLEHPDIDIVFPAVGVRNHIRYNPAAFAQPPDGRTDWEILMALAARLGRGLGGGVQNRALGLLSRFATADRTVDVALRTGPYGLLKRGPLRGLDIRKVKRSRHGIDLGALEPRLPGELRTAAKRVRLAPERMLREAATLEQLAADRAAALRDGYDVILIGRRQLRSNNSWMHNSARLMKGADRCTALLHPDDAAARGLTDGQQVKVTSAVGAIELPLQISDEMRPGVVSIPHGFGHHRDHVGWTLAAKKAGVSVNDITDPARVDRLSGNAAFNAVPVRVESASVSANLAQEAGAEAAA